MSVNGGRGNPSVPTFEEIGCFFLKKKGKSAKCSETENMHFVIKKSVVKNISSITYVLDHFGSFDLHFIFYIFEMDFLAVSAKTLRKCPQLRVFFTPSLNRASQLKKTHCYLSYNLIIVNFFWH